MSKDDSNAVHSALNRLVIAGFDEVVALEAAALVLRGTERKMRLIQQARRRAVFRRDLSAAVVKLGGLPANHGSYAESFRGGLRKLRALLAGAHEGDADAYAACVRAAERSARAYSKALDLNLPDAMRFGLKRQLAEVELDRRELTRLQWAESPPATSEHGSDGPDDTAEAQGVNEQRAMDGWSDDGGRYEERLVWNQRQRGSSAEPAAAPETADSIEPDSESGMTRSLLGMRPSGRAAEEEYIAREEASRQHEYVLDRRQERLNQKARCPDK
jgi:uncharacterized protein (TIGR02284 family)